MAAGPRSSQLHDPEPYWIPSQYVHAAQVCDFCGNAIPRSRPAAPAAPRTTKAYFNSLLKVWECIGCRHEGMRAHVAQRELDAERVRGIAA